MYILLPIGIHLCEMLVLAALALSVCLYLGVRIGRVRPVETFQGRLWICIGILLLGVALGMTFQNAFLSIIFYVAATFVLVPTLITLLIYFIKARAQKPVPAQLKSAALLWMVCCTSVVLVYLSGCLAWTARTNATRNYVSHVVPVIDDIKSRNGSYPKALPPLAGEVPSLAFAVNYSSNGDGQDFVFQYDDSTGMMDGYEFHSTDRKWQWVSY